MPAYKKWSKMNILLLCYKKSHTQTFNGEDELAGVLASIGGHPALPQSSLLSTQSRDLKQCCTLIWVHDSARGLRIQHIIHNRNAGLKKKTHTHTHILISVPTSDTWICAQNFETFLSSCGKCWYNSLSDCFYYQGSSTERKTQKLNMSLIGNTW